MKAISQVAKQFGLSRSTLLYYDKLGLVRPSYRTAAGYRLYEEDDIRRLARICRYREAGLPLKEIGRILDSETTTRSEVDEALHRRLTQLNGEIAALRRQQQLVIKLLKPSRTDRLARAMTKHKWVKLLRSVGMNDAEMLDWHAVFEKQTPEAHQDFLESLGIPEGEIRGIRKRSRERALGTGRA